MESSRDGRAGFTLIEVVVAVLVAVSTMAGIAVLGVQQVHHRAQSDSRSAASQLAAMKMEQLRSIADPATHPDFAVGAHGPFSIDGKGIASVGGPYQWSWVVTDAVPYAGSRRVRVTVSHTTDAASTTQLVMNYRLP